MTTGNRRRQFLVVTACLVVTVIVATLIVTRRGESLADSAVRLAKAVMEGDTDEILTFAFEHEKSQSNINQRNYREMWRELVAPRLARFKQAAPITVEVMDGGHQAHATVTLVDSANRVYTLIVEPVRTAEGPKITCLNLLAKSWILDYLALTGRERDPVLQLEARQYGLAQDRPKLERLGIVGFSQSDASVPARTWAQSEESYRTLIPEMREKWAERQKRVGGG